MLGLIQKLMFDYLEQVHGPDVADDVRRLAGVPPDRRFRLDTVYDDGEFQRIVRAICERLSISQETLEVAYADFFGRDAVRRWPVWFETSANARQLLERQQVIHNTFATGVRDPDARRGITDKFRIETLVDGIETHYKSPNEFCGLYTALARWVLAYYREDARIEEVSCTKRGAPECVIRVRWPLPESVP